MPASASDARSPISLNRGFHGNDLQLSANLPQASVGTPFNATLSVSGGTAPYYFVIARGQLPSGLALGRTTGTISGTPSSAGSFIFGVAVTDARGLEGAAPFQMTVSGTTSVVVTVTPATASVTSSGSLQFTALVSNTSNAAVTWSASAGTISRAGLYEAPRVNTNTPAAVTATSIADPDASATAALTVTARTSVLTIATASLPAATTWTSYSSTLTASGGTTPYRWTIASGQLPAGITLQSSGSVSGTATQTGQFNFTVQAADSSSPQLTATANLALTVSNSTTSGNKITLSFFGADFNGGADWLPTEGQGLTATLAGIRLWDDGVKWGEINTASGVYQWKELDNWLGKAQSLNADVLYTFGDTPKFAAPRTAPGGCLAPGEYSCSPPADVNPDGTGTDADFQAFVTALVTHAAGQIAFYELWNEPDYSGFWTGTQAQLVRMGKDAAAIIRSLDPNAKILSPSAHGGSMATWFEGYIAAGGAPNFDIVNVHMRGAHGTNADPESFLTVYAQVQTELAKRNLTSLPLWDDEHGILPGQGLTDSNMLAGYVARSEILRAGVGLQRQYIYTWDSPPPYGLQANASGTAWNEAANWLIGHSISACTATGTIYTCALDNGEIVWDTAQSCSGGTCSTSNYTYPSGEVWYTDISGNRSALSGKIVPIGYKPILLTNQ